MSLQEENDSEFVDVSENNLKRVHNTVSKVGYSDGITDGRESVFQKGFDSGNADGLQTGFELAKYKAFFKTCNRLSSSNEYQAESRAYGKLNIPDVKDKCHFQMLRYPNQTVVEISKRQLDYVKELERTFKKEMPIVTNLLYQ